MDTFAAVIISGRCSFGGNSVKPRGAAAARLNNKSPGQPLVGNESHSSEASPRLERTTAVAAGTP